MTQEIIQMARDSGMELYGLGKNRARFVHHLEAFAKLVAEKALAEHAMRETQRLGQEIEQAPLEYWNAVEGWVKIDEVRKHFDSVGCATIYKTAGEGRVPLSLAKAQPEQEPVAWRAPNWGHGDDEWVYRDFDDPVLIADGKPSPNNEALYTALPQRTWVGLTEQEHTDIAVECGCMSADWVFYGAAVERKIKEKNTI